MPDLIYCASGNRRFASIALKYGFRYGAQLPHVIYHAPYFVDQNWRNPRRERYMAALREYKPSLATVLDWEREEQLDEVLSWADEAAQWVTQAIIIIPKVMSGIYRLPDQIRGKQVRLGYSVPTRFAGTSVPAWEFLGWPVHLLGGSPQKQHELARYLDVRSADGNYTQLEAVKRNQFFANGQARQANNRWFPQLQESVYGDVEQDTPYFAFELSCMNVAAMWQGCPVALRWAVEGDLPAIIGIFRECRTELTAPNYPALRAAMQRREVVIAESGGEVIGFVHYHARRDGWQTVYDIAVSRYYRGLHIGTGLLGAVPRPVRLKCTLDNAANEFYGRVGFARVGSEPGRKRPLNIWEALSHA